MEAEPTTRGRRICPARGSGIRVRGPAGSARQPRLAQPRPAGKPRRGGVGCSDPVVPGGGSHDVCGQPALNFGDDHHRLQPHSPDHKVRPGGDPLQWFAAGCLRTAQTSRCSSSVGGAGWGRGSGGVTGCLILEAESELAASGGEACGVGGDRPNRGSWRWGACGGPRSTRSSRRR